MRSSARTHAMRALVVSALTVGSVALTAPSYAEDTLADQMHRLRVCESSDNYHANTGNGFYGAYQFSTTTWHNLGFSGRPDRARPATQDRAANKLHSRRGWRPWPYCAQRMHLH